MDLTVRTRLDISKTEPLTRDRLLRRVEVTRQQLSLRWCGRPGGFAGYDALSLAAAVPSSGTVVFRATLVERRIRSHVVELAAVHEHTGTVLLQGHGLTLEFRSGPETIAARPADAVQTCRGSAPATSPVSGLVPSGVCLDHMARA